MQQDLMPGLGLGRGAPRSEQIKIHGADAFDGMRQAGRLAAATLDFIIPHVRPGITTGELDRLCHEFIVGHEAIPAPLNYRGFPKSVCTSINHVVCHGIPGDRRLMDGDILNIDVTVILDGWHGDTSRMFFLGDRIGVKARKLVDVTYDAMMRGTAVTKDRSLSAQFEHTVGVTATGYEIFTISPAGLHRPPYDLSLLEENPRPGSARA